MPRHHLFTKHKFLEAFCTGRQLSRQCKIPWCFPEILWYSYPCRTYPLPTPKCVFTFYAYHSHIIVSDLASWH